jgi:16S rRNA (guanine527-N7)-methyltransferase
MAEGFVAVLEAAAAELGFALTAEQVERCRAFAALVREWNEKINLTALVEPGEMAIKHFADAFTCLKAGDWPPGAKAVDVGTGAGFPGVPLAILRPDVRWVLADAQKKRIEFLQEAVRELALANIACVHARAEELGRQREMREGFDVTVARAVAQMPVLLEYCLPLVRLGGGFLAMKGPEGEGEVQAAARAASILGGGEPAILSLELPQAAGKRTLVWYPKERPTPPAFPRRPGVPAKKPL